ncbi:DUF6064 family protein [Pelagibius sp.]|uniref:DUF6064 family protein n=1 Tax=Pelagibius sp. TaxID=1931238 RepID=UPI003B503EF2
MLAFDAEVLAALFAQINLALWPWQIAFLAAALAVLGLAASGRRPAGRAIGAILTAGWLACGLIFHLHYFAQLSFTAPAFGALFLAQAALLAWSLVLRGGTAFAVGRGAAAGLGFALLAAALLLPLLQALLGESLETARIVGLAPGPTAVFTLGVLLLSAGRCPLHLMVLPLVWTVIAGATAWELGMPADLAQPVLGAAALAAGVLHNRRIARNPA